jgi:hypothetical protein
MTKTPKLVQPPMMGIKSDALPMPPEMFTVIGEIVVLWSRVETALESDTSIMMQYPVVRRLASEAPRGFKKKLELWRRAVRALYPSVTMYQEHASAFVEAARKVSKLRNHLIHGMWSLQPAETGGYPVTLMRALDRVEQMDTIEFSMGLVTALLEDIRTLDNHIATFIVSKMWHAHLGLLRADASPSPAPPTPPKPSKPKRQRRSSPQ